MLRSTETQPACNCRGKRPTNVCPSPTPLPSTTPSPPQTSSPPSILLPSLNPSTPTCLPPNPNALSANPIAHPPSPPKQNVLIGVVFCLGSTPASTTTALSAFFFLDFAFVFKANSVDLKIKLLSWKECAVQCSLHRCPWRFIHCRRRLVSHWNHFAWMWLLSHALEGTGHYSISGDNSRRDIYPGLRFTSVTKCPLVLLCNLTVTSGDKYVE